MNSTLAPPTTSKKLARIKRSSVCADINGYYKLLGLESSASNEEIKHAYKKIARDIHPDVGGDVDEFVALQNAVATLLDPNLRFEYDNTEEDVEYEYVAEDFDEKAQSSLNYSYYVNNDINNESIVDEWVQLITQEAYKEDVEFQIYLVYDGLIEVKGGVFGILIRVNDCPSRKNAKNIIKEVKKIIREADKVEA